MAYCSSYYLYQRYEKRGNQNWLPSYPNVYSIDGEGSQPLRARQMYDTDCGWIPDTEVQYRTVSGTPYCSGETGYDKYVYETYQVSYDGGITWSTTGTADVLVERNSPDCGYVPPIEPIYRWVQITPISGDSSTYVCDECQITPIYRWENSGTTCVNCDKYQRTIKQVSYDNGSTWENVSPAEYSATTLIEANSYDCGYRTRTTSGTPYCSGYNKYVDVYSQVSYDSGSTWSTTATTATITEPCSDDCMVSVPYENQYLTFVPLEECTFRCDITSCQYSLDCGLTWNWFYQDSTVTTNQKVLVRHSEWTSDPSSIVGFQFSSTGRFKVQGNIMSLMYGDNFTGKTTIPYPHLSFMSTFSGCTNLVDAENLVLPATGLTDYCYDAMFQGCTSLVKAPSELPAETLSDSCYKNMFYGCSVLSYEPYIHGRTLANYCYQGMFQGCTSLTGMRQGKYADSYATSCFDRMYAGCTSLSAVTFNLNLTANTNASYAFYAMFSGCTSLSSATLTNLNSIANNNVYQMFDGCSNLSYVKCLASYVDSGSSYCWLRGVAASGTFYKESGTTWVSGESGIPTGWTTVYRQERWVNSGTTCYGYDKYNLQVKEISEDGGQTWTITSQTQRGTLIEANSYDCGYAPPSGYTLQYLTFEAVDSGTFSFSGASSSTINNSSIQYSLNSGTTWNTLNRNVQSPTVSAGQKIMWKGTISADDNLGTGIFSSTGRFNIEGNIMSLYYGDSFSNKTSLSGKDRAFYYMFSGCTGLTSAENLILPAVVLAYDCYDSMFRDCTSLTTAPKLPATTLRNMCYYSMFAGCTSLTKAPALPATNLSGTSSCYGSMFYGCTSLTTAPELSATTLGDRCYESMFSGCSGLTTAPSILPATMLTYRCYYSMFYNCTSLTNAPELVDVSTLVSNCYENMFRNCSSLNYIKCLGISVDSAYTNNWVRGVSSTGTFVKNRFATNWTRGVSGIPTNWEIADVQNA